MAGTNGHYIYINIYYNYFIHQRSLILFIIISLGKYDPMFDV